MFILSLLENSGRREQEQRHRRVGSSGVMMQGIGRGGALLHLGT